MYRSTLTYSILVILFCASLNSAAVPDDYLIEGRELLFNGELTGVRQAFDKFSEGIEAFPDNSEIRFFHALSGLAMLGIRDDGDPANSFLELAKKFNITLTGNQWGGGNDDIVLDVLLNARGAYEIPSNAPDADEIGTILNTMAGQVDSYIADLNTLDNSFVIYLDPNETHVFSDPELPKLSYDVEVDYSDVLLLKVILMGLMVQLQGQQAYNLSIDPNGVNEIEKKVYGSCFEINDLFEDYPDLLKVLPTTGKTVLAQARQNLVNGINFYMDAIAHILTETDPQEDDFLYIDPNDEDNINNINDRLIALRDSLINDTTVTYPIETTKTYNIKKTDNTTFGQLAWSYNLFGDSDESECGLTSSDSQVDMGWWIEQIYIDSGNKLMVDLERWDYSYGLLPGLFEVTLASNKNSFTSGAYSYYDPQTSSWITYASGLTGALASSEVENLIFDLNPIYGSSARYPNPVNPRDLLPQFDEWNGLVRDTMGHGISNNATLGGIAPDMTQYKWDVLIGALQPTGLVTLQSKTATVDGSTGEWSSGYLVFDDITGAEDTDISDSEDYVTGVDIDNLYMSYDSTYLYGAISLKDTMSSGNNYSYRLYLPYQPGNEDSTLSIALRIEKFNGNVDTLLTQCTIDSSGYKEWTEIPDSGLQVALGSNAIEFRITRSMIPGGLAGRFIHLNSDGWSTSTYTSGDDRNDTHLKIAGLGTNSLGTISGTITREGHITGQPIYVWACTDSQSLEIAEDSIVAASMLDAPGSYTLSGLGIGFEGYVIAFTPTYNFNVFDSNNPRIQALEAVTLTSSQLNNVDLTLQGDELPTMSFALSSSEGDEGVNGILTVNLSEETTDTVTVNYSVTGGTATSDADYTLASGTLTFEPNATTKNIELTIVDDTLDEDDETIIVALSGPVNAWLGTPSSHTYTIIDNDNSPSVAFVSSDSSGSETASPVTLSVALSAASGKEIKVDYSATGGTATGGGVDYNLLPGTLTFLSGETSKNISISIVNDLFGEAPETIIVALSNPINAVIGTPSSHTYTIENDDAPTIEFSQSGSSGLEAQSAVLITVTCFPAPEGTAASVNYTVTGGTATEGEDYELSSGTLTFDPGETTQDISLTIVDNSTNEPSETIIITLSDPVHAAIGAKATYTYTVVDDDDEIYPYIYGHMPEPNSVQIARDTLIKLHIADEMIAATSGVDPNMVQIELEGILIYEGNVATYNSSVGTCKRIGTEADYTFVFLPSSSFDYEQKVDIAVSAEDKAGNHVDESYYFYTVMRSFGANAKVNSDTGSLVQDNPDTAMDSSGNIYVVWDQTTGTGDTDIYIGKLGVNDSSFGASTAVYNTPDVQSHPVIAVDSADTLYVAWQQEDANGFWDIYVSSSSDGISWSDPPIAVNFEDPNNESNQTLPDIVIDHDTSDKLYIVCEDDRSGDKDIWIASSTNGITWTPTRITTNTSDQMEPAITVNNHWAVIGWTDTRNASTDLYGASDEHDWSVEGIVTTSSNQSSIAFAVDPLAEEVYEFWVDDDGGYDDIYYDIDSPLSIIDEPNTIQNQPTATFGSSKIFAAWTDWRNVFGNNDTDIYFAESGSPFGTNIIVNDDSGTSAQLSPVINIDINGNPYLVWVDERSGNKDIYFTGATSIGNPLSATLEVGDEGTITLETTDNMQVIIPAGALQDDFDANNITISELNNLPNLPAGGFGVVYNIGPSGLEFTSPVTITIPHDASYAHDLLIHVYWYNAQTGTWSQEGISNVQHQVIDSSTHAVSFQTTHFTSFVVGAVSGGGGGGGGGCAMSQYSHNQDSMGGFFVPYIIYVLILLAMNRFYKHKQQAKNDSRHEKQ